jgi:hypothetical protein
MQGHFKINIDLFSVLCPPQLHKNEIKKIAEPTRRILNGGSRLNGGARFPNHTTMQGHLKINIDLFSALCPPQLHKK